MTRVYMSSWKRSLACLPLLLIPLAPTPALAAKSPPQTKLIAPPVDQLCGDWLCNSPENCLSCPEDCGTCSGLCGDDFCHSTESCSSCPDDCGPCSENRSVVVNAKRYWADYAGNAIRRSNLDGSQVELVHSVNGPFGISYDPAGYLIWTSATDETVQAAAIGGGVLTLQSSFEEYSALVFKATSQPAYSVAPDTSAPETSASAKVAAAPTQSLAYSVIGTEVVKITQDVNTGAEQREVLLTLSYSGEVRGLTLSPDGTALYLGDSVGRMSRKLDLASRAVQWLAFQDDGPFLASIVRSTEARP